MAKTRAEEMHYRFVWFSNGKVLAKKQPGVVRIKSEDDLSKAA